MCGVQNKQTNALKECFPEQTTTEPWSKVEGKVDPAYLCLGNE